MKATRQTYCGCLFYAANALTRKITRLADEEFAATGLAPSPGFIVMTVNAQPGITAGEIAAVMQLQPSTVTRLLDKLETQGLVTRSASGKFVSVHPTIKAQRKDDHIKQAWKNLYHRYTEILGSILSTELVGLLTQATEKLD
jgi:MarR family transcriptional regulator, organic hydroperoxide resistance regulator